MVTDEEFRDIGYTGNARNYPCDDFALEYVRCYSSVDMAHEALVAEVARAMFPWAFADNDLLRGERGDASGRALAMEKAGVAVDVVLRRIPLWMKSHRAVP